MMSNNAPILYVEDEEADAFFMELAFKELKVPNPLKIVADGQLAIEYLTGEGKFADRQAYPLPCLILLDLNLPRMSGHEVLEWIRSTPEFRKLPVVIFSASSLEVDQRRAIEGGADDYIVKPNDLTLIPELLGSVKRRWLDPRETRKY